MPHKPRIFIPEQPLHLVVRGHSKQSIVRKKQDYLTFISLLRKASNKYKLQIHAWVLMSNHLHLLVTPENKECLPRTMQWFGRNYARYFNQSYERTGALWEGRYKTSFIETERYLLNCHCYIEMNPVRAGIVDLPVEYPWSSYRFNGLAEEDELTTIHPQILALNDSPKVRMSIYRSLFKNKLSEKILTEFRIGNKRGTAVGSSKFTNWCQSKYRIYSDTN